MTNLQTHFDEQGSANIDESQLQNLHFDINPADIYNLVTTSIYFKSEDTELVSDQNNSLTNSLSQFAYANWLFMG